MTYILEQTWTVLSHCQSPIVIGKQLSIHNGGPTIIPLLNCFTVGALQYLTLTRPCITFSINKACQFMHNLTILHWKGVKRILRYHKSTIHHGLRFIRASSLPLITYTNVNCTSNPNDKKSMGGYNIYLVPNLISWQATKQKVIAYSSIGLEYSPITQLQNHHGSNPCLRKLVLFNTLLLYYGVIIWELHFLQQIWSCTLE